MPDGHILIVDGGEAVDLARNVPSVEVFKDIDDLVAALPGSPREAAS